MNKWNFMHNLYKNWWEKITPSALKRLESSKKYAGECILEPFDEFRFQVRITSMEKYVVDLEELSCNCRKWDLTGIPCNHIVACMNYKGLDPLNYVNDLYLISNYNKVYEYSIAPLMSLYNMWESKKPSVPPICPPKYNKPLGRPKKLRKKGRNEQPQGHLGKSHQQSLRWGVC